MGWDDNGLPTERRVQNYYGVRCDPSLRYDPSFSPPEKPGKEHRVDLATELHRAVRPTGRRGRKGLRAPVAHARPVGGLEPDLRHHRHDVAPHVATRLPPHAARRARLLGRSAHPVGRRLPDRGVPGRDGGPRARRCLPPAALRTRRRPTGRSTSRRPARNCSPPAWPSWPIPTTIATGPSFGHDVVTPLFDVRVPVLAHPLADPEKGSGIAMICTFGDTTDVTWWRELSLPTRTIVGRNGRLRAVPWGEDGLEQPRPGGGGNAPTASSRDAR